MLQGIFRAVARFPLTVICLLGATVLQCYLIALHRTPELLLQKLMFVCLVGAFLGVTAQFACERFSGLARRRLGVYGLAVLLTLGYYLIIAGATTIDYWVGARTSVAVFSLFMAFIWLPSYDDAFDFNGVALVHFKAALTSALYAGVLTAGLAALIGAVDVLLFSISNDAYQYMLVIVWVLFATTYYLSRLPRFNSPHLADRSEAAEASEYPRILEILISQIAIPLVAAYTLVLLAYFIKIGVTRTWPIGQLGPMVLAYSAAGLIIYVLASRLHDRASVRLYLLGFPKALILAVVMQLISVYIRLQAYGVTESRYYLALFGILSLVVGVVLSLWPARRNGIIALLAAAFAILSVIPPVDAFTVSRQSQVARLERMLQSAGVLESGQLQPQPNVQREVRLEVTNILNYLDQRGHLSHVTWLPPGFQPYRDMQSALGFEPTYRYMPENPDSFFVSLNGQSALPVSGYDALLAVSNARQQPTAAQEIVVAGQPYRLQVRRVSSREVTVALQSSAGVDLVVTSLEQFAATLRGLPAKEMLDASQLTLDAVQGQYRLRIIFQSVYVVEGEGESSGIDYTMYVLVAVP